MSDTSQGPGWWQASDGKWYSPEQVPAGTPPADQASAFDAGGPAGTAPPGWGGPSDGGGPGGYQAPQPGYGPPGAYGAAPTYGPPGGSYGYPIGQQFSNGIGTAAMVLGIIAVVLFWFIGVSWILALLAVTFGGVGLSKANKQEANNRGMAIAGLVCGSLVIAFWVVVFIVAAATN